MAPHAFNGSDKGFLALVACVVALMVVRSAYQFYRTDYM